ncbi:hypothetical protein SAMN05444405_11617 [Bacteroides luti]|uniref:Uncharacterized protein n=1 Tax=Bacteroides luti TaxID=1297750 RepID=A0A1M5F9A4_9BACE|nr:hypothetical protein [Bacteroides luti]SHF88190.1 hypothetical protein SAMN05444405_11617 [Bacteroides luti]
MEKVDEVINLLNDLTVQELDYVKLKIRDLKLIKKRDGKKNKNEDSSLTVEVRISQRERMINYNPYLKGKI